MSVESIYTRVIAQGDGANTKFGFQWKFIDESDIVVYVDDALIPSSEYSLEYPITKTSGSVVFNTAPAVGAIVVIKRAVNEQQSRMFKNTAQFNANEVEKAFDKLTMLVQEQLEGIRRQALTLASQSNIDWKVEDLTEDDVLLAVDFDAKKLIQTSFTQEEVQAVIDEAVRSMGHTVKNIEWDGTKATLTFGNGAMINSITSPNVVQLRAVQNEKGGYFLQWSLDGIEWLPAGSIDVASIVEEAKGTFYTKTEIDDKVAVINTATDANADAIQKTREDYIEADSEIHQILNNHAGELTTLHNDVDDLGDQVAGIESKIPESASETNQLATKADLATGLDDYVKKSGDTMTGILTIQAEEDYDPSTPPVGGLSFKSNASPDGFTNRMRQVGNGFIAIEYLLNGIQYSNLVFGDQEIYIANTENETGNPVSLGTSGNPWDNVYAKKLNNGADLDIPTEGGTLARIEDLDAREQEIRDDVNQVDSELQSQINAHAEAITTNKNDIDGLGDQVSAIEEKIPTTASAENPLVTRSEISSVYKFKGSVATYNDLPAGATVGDVYNVTDTGANYAWDGSAWDKLSETVDLSSYATTAYVNAREQDIRDDYMAADGELQTQINGLSSAVATNQSDISTLRTDVGDLENQVEANHNDITAHIADTSNPHNVTKTQVGLGNVDNTSDSNKPISTATQAALDLKADKSTTYTKDEVDDLLEPKLDSTVAADTYATITSLNAHINNKSNPHTVTKAQVGLGNVDNTSDLNKPVSTAQQNAINTAKQDVISGYTTADGELQQQINGQATAISTNTSNITALTTRVGTNETNIALLDSDVDTINTDLATAKTDITNLKSSVNSQAGLIQGLQDDVSEKVDKNQGTANAGKILSVGSDGQVTLTSAPGGGLTAVAHDSTLTGTGADSSPLGIASTVLAEIADKADQTTVETLSGAVSQNTTNIGTLRTDVDDLGDQVSGIESKIPASASSTNPLATKSEIPTVPTNISAFNNDRGYITSSALTPYATTQALNDGLATKQPAGDYATNGALTSGLALKVAIAQGVENAGKILTVDNDGNVVVGEGGGASLPILMSMWSDHLLNNISWLRADTFSWQSGDVYVAAYEHLVDDFENVQTTTYYAWEHEVTGNVYYTTTLTPSAGDKTIEGYDITSVGADYIIVKGANCYRDSSKDSTAPLSKTETIGDITITYYLAEDGHKICLPDQESNLVALYEATGVAWYFILDTENKQFKLPRTKYGFTGLRDSVGGYVEAGLPNITGQLGLYGTEKQYCTTSGAFTTNSGSMTYGGDHDKGAGLIADFNASNSNEIYGASDTVQPPATQMYLYFYVGNFEQSAIEQTAGITAETLNGKADTDLGNIPANYDYVVESQLPTSANGYTWYRKYKSGWVEQGGRCTVPATNAYTSSSVTVTLPVPISNSALATLTYNGTASTAYFANCENMASVTTTAVTIGRWNNGGDVAAARYYNWTLSGMAAQ